MSAIEAVSKTVKTMSDGTLRLTVDISPIHAQDAFKLFGSPDVPMALARLTIESSKARAQAEAIDEKPKGGFLSQWLAIRCGESGFWEFIESQAFKLAGIAVTVDSKDQCNVVVKELLEIQSKAEIDNDTEAEKSFHELIRIPYAQWLAGARKAAA
jgi:hypothetical protein